MGYYYETATTGVPEVDAIGTAVDRAGNSYHHTEQWTEQDANGRCVVDDIDDALRACAATIAALRSQLAAAEKVVSAAIRYIDGDVNDPWGYQDFRYDDLWDAVTDEKDRRARAKETKR